MPSAPANPAAQPWLADAAALGEPGDAAWVRALRATAAEQFAQTGLPTPAWEGWQYTHLRPLAEGRFRYSAAPVGFDPAVLPAALLPESDRLVLVNGQYQPQLSRVPAGVTAMSLMEAVEKDIPGLDEYLASVGDLGAAPFKALNSAYLRDGVFVQVRPGAEVEKPLEILFYNLGGAAAPAIYPRVLVWLGENSALTVLERHTGTGAYLANSYAVLVQEAASRLKHYKFEEESLSACHVSTLALHQMKSSSFEGFSYACGGRLARQEYRNLLLDSGISSNVGGIYLLDGQQCHDFTVTADHFEPHGTSVQNFRGVVDGQARAVFQGKIHVHRSAQKTDGHQLNHALLLSAAAEADFKPELEIYADDVKCSHGATAGQLDPAALFYLRSRGIPGREARVLLVESFLAAALEQVSDARVKQVYQDKVRAWLAR